MQAKTTLVVLDKACDAARAGTTLPLVGSLVL
jgi:hypothetical protein